MRWLRPDLRPPVALHPGRHRRACAGLPCLRQPRTRRVLSPVTVLGGMGGLTPDEQAAASARQARLASITPKAQIDSLRQSKAEKEGL